jgi:hypothetical protein
MTDVFHKVCWGKEGLASLGFPKEATFGDVANGLARVSLAAAEACAITAQRDSIEITEVDGKPASIAVAAEGASSPERLRALSAQLEQLIA